MTAHIIKREATTTYVLYHVGHGALSFTETVCEFYHRIEARVMSRHVMEIELERKAWLTTPMQRTLLDWVRHRDVPMVAPPWLLRDRGGRIAIHTQVEARDHAEAQLRAAQGRVRRPRLTRIRRT